MAQPTKKLNFKHYNVESTHCDIDCWTKLSKVDEQKYNRPYPIYQGSTTKFTNDPLQNFIEKRQNFQIRLEAFNQKYLIYKKRSKISKQFECYKNTQELLLQDPDKYFCSNYNWYYTGGNLTTTKIDDTNFMFHTMNNTELCVSKLGQKDSSWRAKCQRSVSKHWSDIYQILSVVHGEMTFVGVREKNEVIIYSVKLNDTGNVMCKLVDDECSNIPLVSMCFNEQNHKEYALVNAKHMIKIRDLCTLLPTCQYKVPEDIKSSGDCFAQVSYHENLLAFVNRTTFSILDKRSKAISSNFKLESNESLQLHDRFVNICPNQINHLYYISTFHDILLFDMRNKKVCNKYSHSFTSAPLHSDVNLDTGVFCISSSKPDEKLIVKHTDEFQYIPVSLSTITDEFESSMIRPLSMSLNSSSMNLNASSMSMCQEIEVRLDASTTGMQVWTNEVFSVNALGDIFCHDITGTRYRQQPDSFQKWNKKLFEDREIAELHFVDKLMLKDLPTTILSPPKDSKSLIKDRRLQACIQDLKKCGKGFSDKVSDIWECKEADVLHDIEEIPADVTVRNWLSQQCAPLQ